MRVEEGFLDGLDLMFAPGLNVVIGARGVGKTSLVELIRYGLRLPHLDQRRAAASQQHAEAVLGGGRVTITYTDGDQRRSVSRSASDPDIPIQFLDLPGSVPEVLGQNELEGIGLDPASRLRLIDARASIILDPEDPRLHDLRLEAESLTSQLGELARQRDSYRQEELLRPTLVSDLAEARARENELLSRASAEVAQLRNSISEGTARLSAVRSRRDALSALRQELLDVERLAFSLDSRLSDTVYEHRNESLGPGLQSEFAEILHGQRLITDRLRQFNVEVGSTLDTLSTEISIIDDDLRPLRVEFDRLQSGASEAAHATSQLERQLEEIDSRLRKIPALDNRARDIVMRRDGIMLAIDQIAEAVWNARSLAAAALNHEFSPRIHVALEHFGDRSQYVSRLADALRGSGLQHNQLSEWLAERVTPQELVSATEKADGARLATVGEITPNRVDRLIAHLAASEKLGSILTSRVEDVATFRLLVGKEYKASEYLSTGQRCALVLPLLLAEEGRTLILDQPEDHLDNAYLVDNTVRSLRARSEGGQTIVVTHNANIPVLGNADRVIALQSDGRRGYVYDAGRLSDRNIVAAITELMEGGREAFARRASFYSDGGVGE